MMRKSIESRGESTNDVNSGIANVRITQGPAPNDILDGWERLVTLHTLRR